LADVAYLAQAYHWSFAELLDLEHADRRRLIELTVVSDESDERSFDVRGWT